MEKTPLAQLNSHIDGRIIDTELNYPDNDWNGGYVTAMREIKDKIKELLPAERKMVEDAWKDGIMEFHNNFKSVMREMPKLKDEFASTVFDIKHEQ